MKKIGRLKLSELSKNALDVNQQNALKGGICYCSCSTCSCESWDGTGHMPISRSTSDMGIGSANGTASSNRESNF